MIKRCFESNQEKIGIKQKQHRHHSKTHITPDNAARSIPPNTITAEYQLHSSTPSLLSSCTSAPYHLLSLPPPLTTALLHTCCRHCQLHRAPLPASTAHHTFSKANIKNCSPTAASTPKNTQTLSKLYSTNFGVSARGQVQSPQTNTGCTVLTWGPTWQGGLRRKAS